MAKRYRAVPIAQQNGKLIVALADPLDIFAIDEIRQHTRSKSKRSSPPRTTFKTPSAPSIAPMPPSAKRCRKLMRDMGAAQVETLTPDEEELSAEELREIAEDAPVVRLANMIITQAINDGASDIHIEPTRDCIKVRYRIDGVMIDSLVLPKRVQASLTSRFKIMADMDIAEKRVPQDNRISATIDGREYDFRVSTLPCIYGEKIVMRVLDKSSVRVGLDKIGLPARYARSAGRGHQPLLRHHLGDGTDRLRQVHNALLDPVASQHRAGQHHHGGGPSGVRAAGHQSGAGEPGRRGLPSPRRCARCCAKTPTSSW
jgi:type IV pilus assembly protein PilB